MVIITMENLKYKYPGTDHLALNGITLSIEKGEFIGIVGQNGAGKSTLCQAIIGLVPQFRILLISFPVREIRSMVKSLTDFRIWESDGKRCRCVSRKY